MSRAGFVVLLASALLASSAGNAAARDPQPKPRGVTPVLSDTLTPTQSVGPKAFSRDYQLPPLELHVTPQDTAPLQEKSRDRTPNLPPKDTLACLAGTHLDPRTNACVKD